MSFSLCVRVCVYANVRLTPCKVTERAENLLYAGKPTRECESVCVCVRRCNTLHIITKDRPHARVRRKARNNFFSRDECALRANSLARETVRNSGRRSPRRFLVWRSLWKTMVHSREFATRASKSRRLVTSSAAHGSQARLSTCYLALRNQFVDRESNESLSERS